MMKLSPNYEIAAERMADALMDEDFEEEVIRPEEFALLTPEVEDVFRRCARYFMKEGILTGIGLVEDLPELRYNLELDPERQNIDRMLQVAELGGYFRGMLDAKQDQAMKGQRDDNNNE